MKVLIKSLAGFLSLLLLLSSAYPAQAASEPQVRYLRIFSSADQKRHAVRVIEKDDRVYICTADLAAVMQGEEYFWEKETGFTEFFEQDNIKIKLLKEALKYVGVSTEVPTYYILSNGVTNQYLRYDFQEKMWTLFDGNFKVTKRFSQMPELAEPIVVGDAVYVQLLPFAKALGAIVNVTADNDGLSFYVPRTSIGHLRGLVNRIFDYDTGVIVPWGDADGNTTTEEDVGLWLDAALDIVSGEAISYICGNYASNNFRDVLIATLSVQGEETANYVQELYDAYSFTYNYLTSDVALQIVYSMDTEYFEYINALAGEKDIGKILKQNSPGLSFMNSGVGLAVELYMYQQKMAGMVTENVEAANRVFVQSNSWTPNDDSSYGETKSQKIAKELIHDYYKGIGGDTMAEVLREKSVDYLLGILGDLESSEAVIQALWDEHEYLELMLADAGSILAGAMNVLSTMDIAVQVWETYWGYEFGELAQVATFREFQDILYAGYGNCLEDHSADLVERAQYMHDCAKLAILAKLAFNDKSINGNTGKLYAQLMSIDPRDVTLATRKSIEKLSGATEDQIPALVYDRVEAEFSFWDFAEALGMETYRPDGTFSLGNSCIVDLDQDGQPEYLMCVTDQRLYQTPFYVVLDAETGVVSVNMRYNDMGTEAITTPVWNPDTKHILLHNRLMTQWETSEYYLRWNGEYFEDYAAKITRHSNGVFPKTTYQAGYDSITESQYEEMVGAYDGVPYTDNTNQVDSDHLQAVTQMLRALSIAIPTVKADAMAECPEYLVFRLDCVNCNQNRTILQIGCSRVFSWEEKQNQEFWWEEYAYYYVDASTGEILRIYVPELWVDPEEEAWREANGFS